MPVFTIQTPEGKKLKIEAADQAAALRGAQEWSGQQAQKVGPRVPVVGDAIDAGREAFGQFAQGVQGDYARARQGKPAPFMAPIRNVGNALNIIPAALTAAATRPLARLGEAVIPGTNAQTNEEILGKALMGVRPAPGFVPAAVPKMGARPAPVPKPELRVAKALDRAITRDGAVPMDVAARARSNPAVPAFQAGGDNLAGMAEVVAQSPGAGQRVLRQAVRDQQAGASGRVKTSVGEAYNGQGDYFGTLDAKMAERATAAEPARLRAFAAPINPGAYGQSIEPLLGRIPKKAVNYAMEIAKRDGVSANDLGIEMVQVPGAPSFEMRPVQHVENVPGGGTRTVTRMERQRIEAPMEDAEFIIQRPTMQTLHYIKKGLDQELETYRNPISGKLEVGNGLGAATARLRGEYGSALRRSNPDYDEFMQIWGDESGHLNALELGRDVFSPKMDMNAEQLRKRFAELNDAERDMYRKGVGEALIDQVRRKGGVTEARQLLKNEEFRDRVKVAVPDDESFTAFMSKLEDEVRLQDVANRVVGGSPTYARQAARADLEGQGMDPLDMASEVLNPAGLPRVALKEMLKRVPRKDRSVIGDAEMNELLGNALRDPDEMTRLLNLLEAAKARPPIGASALGTARRGAIPLTEGGLVLQGAQKELSRAR